MTDRHNLRRARQIKQRIRTAMGAVVERTVRQQAGGSEFLIHLADDSIIEVDVTITTQGNMGVWVNERHGKSVTHNLVLWD